MSANLFTFIGKHTSSNKMGDPCKLHVNVLSVMDGAYGIVEPSPKDIIMVTWVLGHVRENEFTLL